MVNLLTLLTSVSVVLTIVWTIVWNEVWTVMWTIVVFLFPLREPGTNELFLVIGLVGEVSSEAQPSEVVSLTALIVEPDHGAVFCVNVILAEVLFNYWFHSLATVGVGEPSDFLWLEVGQLVNYFELVRSLSLLRNRRGSSSLGHHCCRGFVGAHFCFDDFDKLMFVDFLRFLAAYTGFIPESHQWMALLANSPAAGS